MYVEPTIPKVLWQELGTLRLFRVYCQDEMTRDLIARGAVELYSTKGRLRASHVISSLHHLSHAENDEELLRIVVTIGPDFEEAVRLIRIANEPAIIPEGAIPSAACAEAARRAYHDWMRTKAQ